MIVIARHLFYSAPSQPLADTVNVEDQDIEQAAYSEPAVEEVPPPPDFKPFFTLIEDPETGDHHHPTVHYIFSDDDPEISPPLLWKHSTHSRQTNDTSS